MFCKSDGAREHALGAWGLSLLVGMPPTPSPGRFSGTCSTPPDAWLCGVSPILAYYCSHPNPEVVTGLCWRGWGVGGGQALERGRGGGGRGLGVSPELPGERRGAAPPHPGLRVPWCMCWSFSGGFSTTQSMYPECGSYTLLGGFPFTVGSGKQAHGKGPHFRFAPGPACWSLHLRTYQLDISGT